MQRSCKIRQRHATRQQKPIHKKKQKIQRIKSKCQHLTSRQSRTFSTNTQSFTQHQPIAHATANIPRDLIGHTALVTGGSRGIGFAVTKHLIHRGANVIYCSRSLDSVNTAFQKLQNDLSTSFSFQTGDITTQSDAIHTSSLLLQHLNSNADTPNSIITQSQQFVRGYACDVSDQNQIESLFRLISNHASNQQQQYKTPNILVNCAGICENGLLLRANADKIMKTLNTNVIGTMLMTKSFIKSLPALQPYPSPTTSTTEAEAPPTDLSPFTNSYYRVINISSVIGKYGNVGQSAYAASKSAVDGFTRSMSKEMAIFRNAPITFNSIAPGYIDTEMTTGNVTPEMFDRIINDKVALKRVGKPEEVAHLVGFLVSPYAGYINGQNISIDGGM